MEDITMCGYRCDLCKAYAPNIKVNDEREQLSEVWTKYYELNISKEQIYCDGCRCNDLEAKRIDMNCPVRKCVIEKQLDNCSCCDRFPCNTFNERKGLSMVEAKELLGEGFNEDEYNKYLLAYDNLTRLREYINSKFNNREEK